MHVEEERERELGTELMKPELNSPDIIKTKKRKEKLLEKSSNSRTLVKYLSLLPLLNTSEAWSGEIQNMQLWGTDTYLEKVLTKPLALGRQRPHVQMLRPTVLCC